MKQGSIKNKLVTLSSGDPGDGFMVMEEVSVLPLPMPCPVFANAKGKQHRPCP